MKIFKAAWARAALIPCRSSRASGLRWPLRSFCSVRRSRPLGAGRGGVGNVISGEAGPSGLSVRPGPAKRRLIGFGGKVGAGAGASPEEGASSVGGRSRETSRVTFRQRARSSSVSCLPRLRIQIGAVLGVKDVTRMECLRAPATCPASSPDPVKRSIRPAPLIAPPVS